MMIGALDCLHDFTMHILYIVCTSTASKIYFNGNQMNNETRNSLLLSTTTNMLLYFSYFNFYHYSCITTFSLKD